MTPALVKAHMSAAVSTKKTSKFCRMRSKVVSWGAPKIFGTGAPNSFTPMPTVVLKSPIVGSVSDENRTQAGYSAPAKRPTLRSDGRSGRTRKLPCATPCGFRKTGRRAGH